MSERKNVRKKAKTDPMSVRFPIDFWEDLQKNRGVKSVNEAIAFFKKLYDEAFSPLLGNPVMERQGILPTIMREATTLVYDPAAALKEMTGYSAGGGARMEPITEAERNFIYGTGSEATVKGVEYTPGMATVEGIAEIGEGLKRMQEDGAPGGFIDQLVQKTAEAHKAGKKAKKATAVAPNPPKSEKAKESPKNDPQRPPVPAHLKGIEITEWKSENWK